MKDNLMDWILKIQFHLTDISKGPLSGELFFYNRQVSLLDNNSVGRASDLHCQLHCILRSKNNWEMKVLPLPCKRLDIRVARMTTKNGSPVSSRRQTMSSISITMALKNVPFTRYITKQAHTSRFLSLSATAFAIRSSSSSTSCCLWLASFFLIRSVCSWKALKKKRDSILRTV